MCVNTQNIEKDFSTGENFKIRIYTFVTSLGGDESTIRRQFSFQCYLQEEGFVEFDGEIRP